MSFELDSPSTTDMNYVSAEVYRAVFGLAGWKKDPVYIIFKRGLVSTKTGKPLPQATTCVYVLTPKQAKAINWEKINVVRYTINWSLYRTVLSPAIKNDD